MGVVFLALPLLAALIVSVEPGTRLRFPPSGFSLRWYNNALLNTQWSVPLLRSCFFALCSSVFAVIVGLSGAYGLARIKPLRALLTGIFVLPIFIPPVVLAVGQYFFFGSLGLIDTGFAIVLSHTAITFPIAFVFAAIALSSPVLALEDIACTLGAPRWYAIWRITVPTIRSSMLAAGFLSFVTAFDEAVLSLFLGSRHAKTLPRQMFDGLRYDLDPTVAAIAGLAVVGWSAVVLVSIKYRSRR